MLGEESSVVSRLRRLAFVVVTGGSSGIGAEFLKAITCIAPQVTVCNLSRTKPEAFTEGEHRLHFACDLEDAQQIRAVSDRLISLMVASPAAGGVLLVNNSGFGAYGEFPEPTPEHNAAMVDLNCRAPVLLTGLLWGEMVRRGDGAVINVASLAAFQPTPYLSAYAATKAFMLHWSVALDAEWRGRGMRALALCPGPTATNFFRRAGFDSSPLPGYGTTAERVVRDALVAWDRGDAKVVPGRPFKALAFVSRMLPVRLSAALGLRLMGRLRLKPLREGGAVR